MITENQLAKKLIKKRITRAQELLTHCLYDINEYQTLTGKPEDEIMRAMALLSNVRRTI